MEPVSMGIKSTQQSTDPLPFARSYQLEALDAAIKCNTIVFLETGSGKTLIAIMLLRSYSHMLRKPSPFISIFLVPQVPMVKQQADAVKMHTDLSVGVYWGDIGVDFWDADMWKQEIEKYEVFVMTPTILLNNLRHSFFKLSMIKVLIMDECQHARGNHPYACIMKVKMDVYEKRSEEMIILKYMEKDKGITLVPNDAGSVNRIDETPSRASKVILILLTMTTEP